MLTIVLLLLALFLMVLFYRMVRLSAWGNVTSIQPLVVTLAKTKTAVQITQPPTKTSGIQVGARVLLFNSPTTPVILNVLAVYIVFGAACFFAVVAMYMSMNGTSLLMGGVVPVGGQMVSGVYR